MNLTVLRIQHISDIIPGVLYFVLANLLLTLLISWNQWKLSKTQIKELGLQDKQSIQVKLYSETFYGIRYGISLPHKASLYICDQFIFIRPRMGDWLSGIWRVNLPIIFAKDLEPIKALTKINNIYVPISIQPGTDESIEFVFKQNPAITAKTSLYIDFYLKGDYEKVSEYLTERQ